MLRSQRQQGINRYEESLIDRSLLGYCWAQKHSRTVAVPLAAGRLDTTFAADRSSRQDKDFVSSDSVPVVEDVLAVVEPLDQRVAVKYGIVAGVVAHVAKRAVAVELGGVACAHYRVSIWMESIHFVGFAFATETVAGTTLNVRRKGRKMMKRRVPEDDRMWIVGDGGRGR